MARNFLVCLVLVLAACGAVLAHHASGSAYGLLVRQVRYSDSTIGMVPTQIDYADYRDVGGVRIPFKWTVTWTDNQTSIQLTAVQPNVSIDAARFGPSAQTR